MKMLEVTQSSRGSNPPQLAPTDLQTLQSGNVAEKSSFLVGNFPVRSQL